MNNENNWNEEKNFLNLAENRKARKSEKDFRNAREKVFGGERGNE